MIDWTPRPTANELAHRLSVARARGIRAAQEQAARRAAREDPAWGGPANDPYDYASPLANRMPAASSVTSCTLLGKPAVWICEREHLYNSVPASAAPFIVGTVPPGLNYPLSQVDVDALNQHYGITP